MRSLKSFFFIAGGILAVLSATFAFQQNSPATEQRAMLDKYCVTCHNQRLKTGGLTLDTLNLDKVADNAETWEKVLRKLHGGMMPPQGMPRPDEATVNQFTGWL
jgi:mono/diheme cytochrome c family protein